MTIDLADIEFKYDFFSVPLPDGSTLVMNCVDEDFITDDNEETVINRINIVIAPEDGSDNIKGTSVIGLGNDYYTLKAKYEEYNGKNLTLDTMAYCTMEIADNG